MKKHLLFASIHNDEDSCPDENRDYELRVAAGAVRRVLQLEAAIEKYLQDGNKNKLQKTLRRRNPSF